jgi:hypothetical protein
MTSTANSNVHIDSACRIIAGQLKSGPYTHPQAAQKEIDRLRTIELRASVRRAKGGDWFATLEEGEGYTNLYSAEYSSKAAAEAAAAEALKMIRN